LAKKKLNEYPEPPKGILELWERILVEWEKIPRETCEKPTSSMPDRVRAVYKAKGGYTKYILVCIMYLGWSKLFQ
jgi:hypothetical protein